MITNNYFNNYEASNEQVLLEDLIIESIKIYGINCIYVARTLSAAYNKLYEADDQSVYEQNWMIEIYLKNVFGFGGDREFMSKLGGFEMRDQLIFTISQRRFMDEIGRNLGVSRPREGDVIYFPFKQSQKIFQIKYVNQTEVFYQLGTLYSWELTCELFEYSSEKFRTGIPELDDIEDTSTLDILSYTLKDTDDQALVLENGDYWVYDTYGTQHIVPTADNKEIDNTQTNWVDWTIEDPFTENDSTDRVV